MLCAFVALAILFREVLCLRRVIYSYAEQHLHFRVEIEDIFARLKAVEEHESRLDRTVEHVADDHRRLVDIAVDVEDLKAIQRRLDSALAALESIRRK